MTKNQYLIELSDSAHTDFGRVDFSKQQEPQKVFSAIWALESQVNNGGFLQYFRSLDFDTVSFSPGALKAIGAAKCAEIVQKAISLLSNFRLPDTHSECENLIDSLNDEQEEQFDELDAQFFAYPDDLTELLFDYVKSHPDIFEPLPTGH